MTSLFSVKGKNALITGASSGIGAEIALALANAGANVLLLARREELLLEQQKRIQTACPQSNVAILTTDLTQCKNDSDWQTIHQQFREKIGEIDILCNVAGINLRQPWDEITADTWQQTIDINLSIPFFLARQLVPKMIDKGWGKIINIASLQSMRAFPNSMPYGASKGGVMQLTRAMAEAWSRNGISVNAIAPGFFPTELTAPVFNDTQRAQKLAEQTSCKRNGELKDLHGISVFLASPASDYITGQTLFIDGGFTAS
jgi:NAD(P)-dependent dehydrogenase (short-subunit alcohol dehydrogenase family)